MVDPNAKRTFQDQALELVEIMERLKPNVYVVKTSTGKKLRVNIRRLILAR